MTTGLAMIDNEGIARDKAEGMSMNTSGTGRRPLAWAILTIFIFLLPVSRAAGQVFSDDAESAVMEAWVWGGWATGSGSMGTPSQVQVHSGKWSYAFQSGQSAYWTPGYTNPDPQYLKFWFYVPSSYSLGSGSTTNLAGFESTSTLMAFPVKMTNSSGTLYTVVGSGTGTHAISTNAWHTIELEYAVSAGTLTLWLDGTQDIALTGQQLGPENTVYLGLTAGTGTIYFDDITVSSAASGNPTSGITVRHAYPGNRLAVKVQTYLWGAALTDQLVSSIDGTTFSTITNPGTYQEPILTLTSLSAGSHTLQVQLQTSGGTARATWTETIAACGCTPTNGIDAYNNIVRNGHKVFPITPWMMNPDNATLWAGWGTPSGSNMNPPGINAMGWTSGWAGSYSISQYQSFMEATDPLSGLNCLNKNNFPVIGPSASRMGGYGSDSANMAAYAAALTNEPCVLAWFGYDEASVNGFSIETMQGTMNAAHANDNNHAFLYDDATTPYLHQSWYYPTLVADIYSSDNYPLCYSISYANWAHMMDRDERANYGLVPNFQVLELAIFPAGEYANFNCSASNQSGTSISNTTVNNEFWMAVIHDRKGIGWYTDMSPPYDSGYSPGCTAQSVPPATECYPVDASGNPAIAKPASQVAAIGADTILAAPTGRTISTNQTTNCVASPYTAGARVDATYREYGGYIWIFAARLTDPLCNTAENSASPLSTTITVSGMSGSATATVYGESRTVPVTNGVLTDSFGPWAVHIYQIPVVGGGTKVQPPTNVLATPH